MVAEKKKVHKKTRGELKTEATREALLEAALVQFAKKGMEVTTIDEITEEANVGKGTFYYHFENKGELIGDLIDQMITNLRAVIDSKCSEQKDLESLLDCMIGAHINYFNKRWEDFVLFFQGKTDLTLQEGYAGLDEHFSKYLDHIAQMIDAVIKHRLSEATLIRIACAVAGFVSGYYSFAVIAIEDDSFKETLKPVRGALVQGLARFIREAIPADGKPQSDS